MSTQEKLRPFPWSRSRSRNHHSEQHEAKPHKANAMDSLHVSVATPSTPMLSVITSPRTCTLKTGSSKCSDDVGFLEYLLPPPEATAGKVLQHAKSTIMALFSRYDPMVFKVGYTHDPFFRWGNKLYGYKFDKRDAWSKMVVLYESSEPYGPAMLEASLIDLFKGILVFIGHIFWSSQDIIICDDDLYSSFQSLGPYRISRWFFPYHQWSLPRCPGKPGCRNIKAGGDTIATPSDSLDESRYYTYLVYKSFKYPPPVKPNEPKRVRSHVSPHNLLLNWNLRVWIHTSKLAAKCVHWLKKLRWTCFENRVTWLLRMETWSCAVQPHSSAQPLFIFILIKIVYALYIYTDLYPSELISHFDALSLAIGLGLMYFSYCCSPWLCVGCRRKGCSKIGWATTSRGV